MEINFSDMVEALFKSGEEMKSELTVTDLEAIHAVIGLSGESAELLLPNLKRDKEFDIENILEELGDLEFYLEKLRTLYGLRQVKFSEFVPYGASQEQIAREVAQNIVMYCGLILDIVKKHVIYRKPLKEDSLQEAVTSLEFELNMMRKFHNLTKEEVIETNIKKLGKRYEGFKYSNQAAQDRADKQ